MPTVEDLKVSLSAAGAREAQREIEGVEQSLDESADSMGDNADQMGALRSKWSGAMKALTAGLSIATGFLLSRVPVVGEAMSGLESVVDAFALKLDSSLRPSIGGVTDELFDLADAIHEAEGTEGALDTIASRLDEWEQQTAVFTVETTLELADGAVSDLESSIEQRGITLTLWDMTKASWDAFESNVLMFTDDLFWEMGRRGAHAVVSAFSDNKDQAHQMVDEFFADPIGFIREQFDQLNIDVSESFNELVDNALGWGNDLIGNLIAGIKERINDLQGMLNQNIAGDLSLSDTIDIATGGGQNQNTNPRDLNAGGGFMANRSEPTQIFMDGRLVTSATSRWRQSETSRRGRNS